MPLARPCPNLQSPPAPAASPHLEVAAADTIISDSNASWATKAALEFLVLTATRSGEVSGARFSGHCVAAFPRCYTLTNHRWGYPVPETSVAESVRSGSAAKAINLKVAVSPLRRVRHRFESASSDPKDGYTRTDEDDSKVDGDPRPYPADDD